MADHGRPRDGVIRCRNGDRIGARLVGSRPPRVGGMSSLQASGATPHRAAAEGASIGRWVFITWYPYCRRSDALGEQLGAPSYLVHYLKFKTPVLAPFKYVL